MEDKDLRQIPLAALLIVTAVILPQFFHWLGLGSTFLPMFLPVIFAGMLMTWKFAVIVAVTGPLLSWLLTGMPPVYPPVLPVMLVELVIMSLIISLLRVHGHMHYWIAYIPAIIIDRLILYLLVSLIAPQFGWNDPLFSIALVSTGLPGIIMQIIVLPLFMETVRKKFPQWYRI
ncbi:MAG: hypothetical protein JXR46_15965 [Calditrichaceae bacterium]|nr:hypothetical protein [Calditrichaceae bacterium]MBN2710540.1 hypothetical protein [Calditrichaceae bacterium]RQV96546.1 MAG: ECF transporter S component [Calditrichota bacterium]